MTATTFGKFLEFSVPTPDIQASLNFYCELGFCELSVRDVRDYHYGVVTDGRIAIGLHAGGLDQDSIVRQIDAFEAWKERRWSVSRCVDRR